MIRWSELVDLELQTLEDGRLNLHLKLPELRKGLGGYLQMLLVPVVNTHAGSTTQDAQRWIPKVRHEMVKKLQHHFRTCRTLDEVADLIEFREAVRCE